MLGYWYRLYNNMTPAEKALEPAIAALGEPYRCQHPFLKHKLFADFALLGRKLVIEVDGDSHNKPSQKKKDLEHTLALKSDGWEVVRVTNEMALAIPADTVEWCLNQTPQTTEQLTRELERLKAEYPSLFEPKTPKPRKPRQPSKARAAGKRASGRRKQPAA
jgi:very-short-patch-repair endonuclease